LNRTSTSGTNGVKQIKWYTENINTTSLNISYLIRPFVLNGCTRPKRITWTMTVMVISASYQMNAVFRKSTMTASTNLRTKNQIGYAKTIIPFSNSKSS